MITQRIDAHLARAKRATVSVGEHLGDGRSETPAEKSLPNVRWETSYRLLVRKFRNLARYLDSKPREKKRAYGALHIN